MLRQKIIDEINEVPEEQLGRVYDFIRAVRLQSASADAGVDDVGNTPDAVIIEDLHQSMKEVLAGQTIPVSQMWDGIDLDD